MKRMACVIALAAGTGIVAGTAGRPALAEPASAVAKSGLQVAITTPNTLASDATMVLDVNFRGGNIRSVELYVDGTLMKKQAIRTRDGRGLISFELDGSLLAEGAHDVLVKATDQEGNVATATSRLKVVEAEVAFSTKFLYPKRQAMVQGVVPIQVKIDSSIRNPYVTFLLDNDFLAFTNYAPFTYNWDSSRVANGPHTIKVQVYDGEAALVKELNLPINVNNAGGLTTRQATTPDLNKVGKGGSGLTTIPAEMATPEANLEADTVDGGLSRAIKNAVPTLSPHAYSPSTAKHIGDSHNINPNPTTKKSSLPFLAATAQELNTLSPTSGLAGSLARQTMRPRRAGNIAARPSMELGAVAQNSIANGHGKPTNTASATQSLPKALVGAGALDARSKTFDVAFDNSRITFDVLPRVEKGLPLAPFRQIFEHTGGEVRWFNQSKTMRAFNSSREIEIRVGQSEAKVNNQTLSLDAKPYLDKGRTIVPLSFVRDALDVNIQYNPKTGHLLIESKK